MWWILLACSNDAPSPSTDAVDAPTADVPAGRPAGRIGGAPILEKPIIIGGIAHEAVEDALSEASPGIEACHRDHAGARSGKVLLRWVLDAHGGVHRVSKRASSLRVPETETCLTELVSQVRFPPLTHGTTAIVNYPFAFEGAQP